MAIDSFALYCMLPHLRQRLRNRRLRDVVQTSEREIVLRFRRREDETSDPCLLLSAHATLARVHTVPRLPKVKDRPHFADVLFKHLFRAELMEIEQVGYDRVLRLRFGPPPGLLSDDSGGRILIAEMMGKHSNLILVHEVTNRILEAIKHVGEQVNRYREVVPGADYVPPPPNNRADPFALTLETFAEIVDPGRAKATWKQLLEGIDGFNPALAKEIVARSVDPESVESLWETTRNLVDRIERREIEPVVYHQGSESAPKVGGYALFPPVSVPYVRLERFETIDAAIAAYHGAALRDEALRALRHRLSQALDRREEAVYRRLDALRADHALAESADTDRLYGELLMASLHTIGDRAEKAVVVNYYDPEMPEIEIPLDPSKTAVENAQAYFKRYRRFKRGAARIAQRLEDAETELEWVADVRSRLEASVDLPALETLRDELIAQGWIKEPTKKRRAPEPTPYRTFTIGDWRLLVGRNDRENETLITRVARKDDFWLHAKQIPGSHVIIRNPEKKTQIPMPVLLKAARLAAHFSKARHSSHVPVDYTMVRYVVRPKGTPAGFVTYTREKTLHVEPESPSELFRDLTEAKGRRR